MMRTPSAYAVAVRRADGTITHTAAALPKWSDKYPFFTGKQKLIDTAGRVDRFNKRYGKKTETAAAPSAEAATEATTTAQ